MKVTEAMRSAVKDAFAHAEITHYTPTAHAIERAKLRFGVEVEKAREWINDKMRNAQYLTTNEKGQVIYGSDGIRLVADDEQAVIVTVYNELKTDFLAPMLGREKRKLKRYYTKVIREKELQYAEFLRDIADLAINRAKARNPKTRELIAERIADKQKQVNEIILLIERLNDEWKAKERAIEVIAE